MIPPQGPTLKKGVFNLQKNRAWTFYYEIWPPHTLSAEKISTPIPYTPTPGSYMILNTTYMVQELFLGVKNSKNTKKENSWKSSVFAELSVWNFAEPNLKFGPNSSAEPVPNR